MQCPFCTYFILSSKVDRFKSWDGILIHYDYAKAFDFVDNNKLWKILKEKGIPDHLTCLLRNLNASQEATVGTGHGTTDWFQMGKGVHQGYIVSPCLFNLYAEYIVRNAGLDEAQTGIKSARRNVNNLRYVDDTTLRGESEEELKSSFFKRWEYPTYLSPEKPVCRTRSKN